jgi:hypothetical protein
MSSNQTFVMLTMQSCCRKLINSNFYLLVSGGMAIFLPDILNKLSSSANSGICEIIQKKTTDLNVTIENEVREIKHSNCLLTFESFRYAMTLSIRVSSSIQLTLALDMSLDFWFCLWRSKNLAEGKFSVTFEPSNMKTLAKTSF